MFKFYFLNLILLVFITTTVFSQDYPARIDKGKSLVKKSNGVVLYEQLNNFGSNGITSQNFETIYDSYDNQVADDFIIPVGDDSWTIESVEVPGVYFNGTGPASSVNIWFYNDNLGLPGTIETSRLDIIPTAGITTGSFLITLNLPVTLQPGHYWLSVQCNMDSAFGQWGWMEQLQSNSESAWQNPGSGWANSCSSWGYRITSCNIGSVPYYDLSFRLNGFKGDPCPVESASNPSPSDLQANVQVTGIALGWSRRYNRLRRPHRVTGRPRHPWRPKRAGGPSTASRQALFFFGDQDDGRQPVN